MTRKAKGRFIGRRSKVLIKWFFTCSLLNKYMIVPDFYISGTLAYLLLFSYSIFMNRFISIKFKHKQLLCGRIVAMGKNMR